MTRKWLVILGVVLLSVQAGGVVGAKEASVSRLNRTR